jgi:hypothetical protein
MNIYSADNPRLYYVTGNLHTEDGRVDSSQMDIFVIDTDRGDTLIYTKPTEEGVFAFQLKQGIYELHFKGEGYNDLIRPLQITTRSNKQGITLEDNIELALITKKPPLFEGDESKIKLKESQVEGVAGVPMMVPITAPKGSTVVARTYQDSVLISTDTIVMDRRKTDLQIVPLTGISAIELEMTDEDGAIHRNRFIVVGSEPEAEHLPEILKKVDTTVVRPDIQADMLLSDHLANGSASMLRQLLIENSGGPLKEFLQQLDLDAEGIHSDQELLNFLEKEAETESFTRDDVRRAMLASLDKPLEVDPLFGEENSGKNNQNSKAGWPLLVLLVVAGIGFTWFIIVWWRRRDKREKQGE